MIFVKGIIPIFYLEGASENQIEQISNLESVMHIETCENECVVIPELNANQFEWEQDIREIINQ